jgi:O-antigen/teichoic acid export membrane protein
MSTGQLTPINLEYAASPPVGSGGGRAVLTIVISKFGILFLNAATGIITARALKPEGRGELAAMILWPMFLTYVTTLGIPSSMIYMLKRHPEDQAGHVAAGLSMTLVLGIVAALAGSAALPLWLGRQYSHQIVVDAQLFLVATPLLSLIQTGRAVIEARGLFSYSNQVQILYPGTTLLGLASLLASHRLTPVTAALAYTGSAVPNCLLVAYRIWPLLHKHWQVQRDKCQLLLSYGIRSYGVDLLGTLSLQVDQVIVISILSASQMGAYGVVLNLSRMFNLFQGSIVMVLFPRATGRPAEEVVSLVERSARIGTLVTAFCSLIVALVGSGVLAFLYGKEYAGATNCLRVLLLEVTFSGCVFILAQAFMALGRPGIVTVLQAIGLSLSVPLMLVLVPRYGVMGAAVSLLISTTARLLFVLCGFHLFLKIRSPNLLPHRDDFVTIRALWRVSNSSSC